MIKPLVIGRSYLNEKSSTGQVLRSFFEPLTECGFSPTVICSKSCHNDVDSRQLKCRIIPTYDNQFVRYAIAFAKRAISSDFAFLPDYSFFSWAKISAINEGVKLANSEKFDYIHSVSTPCSSHLIAAEIIKKVKMPWIASFFDPWYENPYRIIHNKWAKERDRRQEEYIAKNADVIIHTNQVICEEWIKRYGECIRNKMVVLPLVFNEPRIDGIYKKNNDKFIISHIGSLYEGRCASDFLKAVYNLIKTHPDITNKIEIVFVGTVPQSDKKIAEKFRLDRITKYAGFLTERECLDYFIQSDLFVAIDGSGARDIFFPSKIMKYLYFGKPILGLSPYNSVLHQELNASGNHCFLNTDTNHISEFLYKAITEYETVCTNDKNYWMKFSINNVAIQYQKLVNDLL